MNKKTVLFLINGFGVEKKESFSIYDASIMPTFDMLTKTHMFSTIDSKVNNYFDAYRNISLDVNELYNYTLIDKDVVNKTLVNNQVLQKLKSDMDTKKSNLHIFCLVDTSMKIVEHLKETLKYLNPNRDKKVYLHLIISSMNIEDYKGLIEVFSHLNIEMASYAPIGFIMGLSAIDNTAKAVDLNFFFKMFISKVGEKWQSFTQKFDVLYATRALPRNTKPFMINTNFELSKDDIFFFYNYDNINLTNFIDSLSGIAFGSEANNFSYYSLFNVTSNKQIPYMYNLETAKYSMVSNLESIKATGLVLCSNDKIPIINYFCNGLKNEATDTLKFVDITPYENNPTGIVSIINQFNNDLIIVNFDVDNVSTVDELKTKLTNVDNVLKAVYDNINGSKYTLIISSLYGMNKVLKTERGTNANVIFAGRVPFIYIDDFITGKNYLIEPGTINDIPKSVYKNINKDSNFDSIVEKKNGLYKLFFK